VTLRIEEVLIRRDAADGVPVALCLYRRVERLAGDQELLDLFVEDWVAIGLHYVVVENAISHRRHRKQQGSFWAKNLVFLVVKIFRFKILLFDFFFEVREA